MKAKWKESNENIVPFVSNTSNYLPHKKNKGYIRHVMIELIFYNKVVVIRKKDES